MGDKWAPHRVDMSPAGGEKYPPMTASEIEGAVYPEIATDKAKQGVADFYARPRPWDGEKYLEDVRRAGEKEDWWDEI